MNLPSWLDQKTRRTWAIFCHAGSNFSRIDGVQWAGAFAFNAFFSLLPLTVLLVAIASFFVERDTAGQAVIAYIEGYIPISGEMQHHLFDTIAGVIEARERAGVIAVIMLVWGAIQCFTTLISATNRAWSIEAYNWWQLPLKSLIFLAIMVSIVLLGVAVPVLAKMVKDWLSPVNDFRSWIYALGNFFIPVVVMFSGLSLFYRLAPRRDTRFAEVWAAALCATVLLRGSESLFEIYLTDFATLNAVYGAFGGIIALLLWIYVSGCVFIFGGCLCAAADRSKAKDGQRPSFQSGT